jgi:response regulator NasT
MAGEKYIVAAAENPMQIMVRNILNPSGFTYLGNCGDAVSLMRLVRSFHPDFIIADLNLQHGDVRNTIETVDDEMLCAIVLLDDQRDNGVYSMVEKSNAISFCPKPLSREVLLHTVELANINYKRVFGLDKKLKEMTENYESRKQVERAKWILMERDGMSESEAYDRIRKKSMDNRMTMRTIAEAIIYTYEIAGKG